MKSYNLDSPIQLERITSYTTNSLNEKIPNWENLGPRIMAEQSFRSASENIKAQQVQATMITRFVIRWASAISDLNPKDRLVADGITHEILQVFQPTGRNQWLEIHTIAKAD